MVERYVTGEGLGAESLLAGDGKEVVHVSVMYESINADRCGNIQP